MTVKRPNYNSKEVGKLAAEMLLPEVIQWLKDDGDDRAEEERDQILDNLIDSMEYESDGFRIAEQLKSNHYWEPDARLVDILDGNHKYDAHKDLVRKWVKENDIKPGLNLESKVTVNVKGKTVNGVIVRIDYDTAQYTVFCESLGHVREGVGTHGVIFPYEEVLEVVND